MNNLKRKAKAPETSPKRQEVELAAEATPTRYGPFTYGKDSYEGCEQLVIFSSLEIEAERLVHLVAEQLVGSRNQARMSNRYDPHEIRVERGEEGDEYVVAEYGYVPRLESYRTNFSDRFLAAIELQMVPPRPSIVNEALLEGLEEYLLPRN